MPEPRFEIPFHKRFRHAEKRPHLEALATPVKRAPSAFWIEGARLHMERIVPQEQARRIGQTADREVARRIMQAPVRHMHTLFQQEFRADAEGVQAAKQETLNLRGRFDPSPLGPQDDFNRITQGVGTAYKQMFGMTPPGRYAHEAREKLARMTGCEAIGDKSSYAVMVGVPKDMPDVVVKVCTGRDAFIPYARACLDGELSGKHFLKVYSAAEVQPGVWVFVIERLWYKLECSEYNSLDLCDWPSQRTELHRNIMEVRVVTGRSTDLHDGNIMKRRDGTVVLLDPVF